MPSALLQPRVLECFQSTFVDVVEGTYEGGPSLDPVSHCHPIGEVLLGHLDEEHWLRCASTGKDGIGGVAAMGCTHSVEGGGRVFGCVEGEGICLEDLLWSDTCCLEVGYSSGIGPPT